MEVIEFTPSDGTHASVPAPSKPKNKRAGAARCVRSPSDVLILFAIASRLRDEARTGQSREAVDCRRRTVLYSVDEKITAPQAASTASRATFTSPPEYGSSSSVTVPSACHTDSQSTPARGIFVGRAGPW